MNDITTTAKPNLFRSLVTESLQRTAEATLRNNWYKDNLAMVYLIRVKHYRKKGTVLYDEFLKIGFNSRPHMENRIAMMPQCHRVEVLQTVIFEKSEAYHIEQMIHKGLKKWKYVPKHKFSGYTECYRPDLLTEYCDLNQMIEAVTHPKPVISTPYSLN